MATEVLAPSVQSITPTAPIANPDTQAQLEQASLAAQGGAQLDQIGGQATQLGLTILKDEALKQAQAAAAGAKWSRTG